MWICWFNSHLRIAFQVEVDLAFSAHANARRWYEQKKKQETKQEKTVTAHEKAFKAAERKTRLQLSQVNFYSCLLDVDDLFAGWSYCINYEIVDQICLAIY